MKSTKDNKTKRTGKTVRRGAKETKIVIELDEDTEQALREIARLSNESFNTVINVLLAAELVRTRARREKATKRSA